MQLNTVMKLSSKANFPKENNTVCNKEMAFNISPIILLELYYIHCFSTQLLVYVCFTPNVPSRFLNTSVHNRGKLAFTGC